MAREGVEQPRRPCLARPDVEKVGTRSGQPPCVPPVRCRTSYVARPRPRRLEIRARPLDSGRRGSGLGPEDAPGSQGGETVHSVRLDLAAADRRGGGGRVGCPLVAGARAGRRGPRQGGDVRGRRTPPATATTGSSRGRCGWGAPVTRVVRSRSPSTGPGSWCRRPRSSTPGRVTSSSPSGSRSGPTSTAEETYDIVRKGIAYTVPGEYKLELLASGRVRCSAKDARTRLATVTSLETLPEDGELAPDRVCPHRPSLERPGRRDRDLEGRGPGSGHQHGGSVDRLEVRTRGPPHRARGRRAAHHRRRG